MKFLKFPFTFHALPPRSFVSSHMYLDRWGPPRTCSHRQKDSEKPFFHVYIYIYCIYCIYYSFSTPHMKWCYSIGGAIMIHEPCDVNKRDRRSCDRAWWSPRRLRTQQTLCGTFFCAFRQLEGAWKIVGTDVISACLVGMDQWPGRET